MGILRSIVIVVIFRDLVSVDMRRKDRGILRGIVVVVEI